MATEKSIGRDYPLSPTPNPELTDEGKKKSIEERISKVENNPRLNRRIERRYERYDNKIKKAEGDSKKIEKIEKKYGYNMKAAKEAGLERDETGDMGSLDPYTGMVLKGPKHPSIMKTRKIERILGNKIVKRDGERYSIPKKNNIIKGEK